jgi:hypothetical protein
MLGLLYFLSFLTLDYVFLIGFYTFYYYCMFVDYFIDYSECGCNGWWLCQYFSHNEEWNMEDVLHFYFCLCCYFSCDYMYYYCRYYCYRCFWLHILFLLYWLLFLFFYFFLCFAFLFRSCRFTEMKGQVEVGVIKCYPGTTKLIDYENIQGYIFCFILFLLIFTFLFCMFFF